MQNAKTPAHNRGKAGCSSENTLFATSETLSAITSFLKKPHTISNRPSTSISMRNVRSASSCGNKWVARSMGPATSRGKNALNKAMLTKLLRARTLPQYTSIT